MNNKEIHKFYKFLKAFPEHHVLMKNLLIDYLKVRDENEMLHEEIEFLEEQIEQLNTQETIH
jgi:cell division protein FtsB